MLIICLATWMTKKPRGLSSMTLVSTKQAISFAALEKHTILRVENHRIVRYANDLRIPHTNQQVGVLFTAFKISAIELEERLSELPYVSEACVLSILDHEARELPAAVIRIEDGMDSQINLRRIRDDLSPTTEIYKLPVMLRILRAGEDLPRTLSGKAMKNKIREKYFQLSGYRPRDYAVPGVEVWDLRIDMKFIQNAGKIVATVPA